MYTAQMAPSSLNWEEKVSPLYQQLQYFTKPTIGWLEGLPPENCVCGCENNIHVVWTTVRILYHLLVKFWPNSACGLRSDMFVKLYYCESIVRAEYGETGREITLSQGLMDWT